MSDLPDIKPEEISAAVARALSEDVGAGDISADVIPASARSRARVIAREHAVICGRAWFEQTFVQIASQCSVAWRVADGDEVEPDTVLCEIEGPTRALLTGERTALNFLQMLSGTATATRAAVRQLKGTGTRLLDTRKTIPGLRSAQKYAVRCGGGHNHRQGLFDAVLIKENHIGAAGSIGAAVTRARTLHPGVTVEVEVEALPQLDEAIAAGADIAMLDNFDLDGMRAAVTRAAGRIRLEASGGLGADDLRAVGATGVDFVSVGALTKNVRAVDLSMRFEEAGPEHPA